MDETPPRLTPQQPESGFNPWLFIGALLISPIVMLFAPTSGRDLDPYLTALISSSFFAALIGTWQLTRLNRSLSPGMKIFIGFLYFTACLATSLALGFGGCLLNLFVS